MTNKMLTYAFVTALVGSELTASSVQYLGYPWRAKNALAGRVAEVPGSIPNFTGGKEGIVYV